VVSLLAIVAFAYPGFCVASPFVDAFGAGRQRKKALNFSAGIGVGWSVLFTAAATSPMTVRWPTGEPYVAPHIVEFFQWLIPNDFQPVIGSLLERFEPFSDFFLLGSTALVGCIALIAGHSGWMDWVDQSGLPPVLLAAVAGVVLALILTVPLVLAVAWVGISIVSGVSGDGSG
jgi:hypothetical protein